MTTHGTDRGHGQNVPASADEYVAADDAVIGRAFRWSLVGFAVLAAAIVTVLMLRRDPTPESKVIDRGTIVPAEDLAPSRDAMPVIRFTDITEAAGITFRQYGGATGEKLLPETMGGGVAFLDYDNDGRPDLLLVNGMDWPDRPPTGRRYHSALYRNLGDGRFREVTDEVGLDFELQGMGIAVGDYDADGNVDVYLTAVGPNRLLGNSGGRFEDRTAEAGVAGGDRDWSTSAGFVDYDRDGALDLFVCNYVEWSREIDLRLNFSLNGVDRAYGPPTLYRGTNSVLYRNAGGSRFIDVSAHAGIHVINPAQGAPMGKGLAVIFRDIDDDGWMDILVANDTVQNFLFRNMKDGTFTEVGTRAGVAFDPMGTATGAMGIDVEEFANDGRLAIGIGNFANEATSFFVQSPDRPWQFADTAGAEGVGSPSRLRLSFGLFFFDADLDGRPDLLQANGHIEDEINEVQPSQTYRQPAQLFWNRGPEHRACYTVMPDDRTGDLGRPIVGRGAAYADIDGDGDLDVILTQVDGPPLLLRNDQATGHHWLRVRLRGDDGNPAGIGARIELTAGGVTQRRVVMPTRSYLSQVEPLATFGLGSTAAVDTVEVVWPDGARQRVDVPGVDREIEVRRQREG